MVIRGRGPRQGRGQNQSPGMDDGAGAIQLAAPWYVHPASDPAAWDRLTNGSALAFAVVNAANGPAPDDPYYKPVLAAGSATPLLGYVDTAYGSRPAETVLAEARLWLEIPAVQGIMLDCVPSVLRQGAWNLDMIERLRELGAETVAVNPGTPPDPALIQHADVTCVAEFDWATFQNWTPPDSLRGLAPERLWMLTYDVPPAEQPRALALLQSLGAGMGWATEGVLPNPWATLPAFW